MKMWSKLTARFKAKDKSTWHIDVDCLNCGTNFSGHFCPNCGQAVKEYDKPFGFIFYNFLGDFFAFDTRFFKTLFALIARPGFISKEYFAGRRVRYTPPLRIFVFVSFILFLLLQTYTNRGLNTVLDTSFKDGKIDLGSSSFLVTDSIMSQATNELNDSEKQLVDSLMNKMGGATDSIAKSDIQLNVETFRDASDLRLALNKYADKLEKQLETETDPKQQAELREFIRLCHSPETAMARILKYISYAFFLLLPIFALLLKLIYIRRKHNYMRHLVFSIHIHSFIFLVMTSIVAMYMIFEGNINTIAAILFLSVPIYIIIALKKFYGQTLAKVIAKFIMLSVTYYLIFFVVIFIASLDAIKLI